MNHRFYIPLLTGCLLIAAMRAQTPLTTTRVGAGFVAPVWCGSPPTDHARLFVAEQSTGRILIIKDGVPLATPFVTVTGILQTGGECGLLGVAFHPDFATNGLLYVDYTRAGDGATMVDEFAVLGDPRTSDLVDMTTRTTVIGPIAQPFSNHNGGNIMFGPDGYLYIGMGDGGAADDPSCRAQNRTELLGKMLRIDVGTHPYSIPPGNPFAGDPQYRGEIWALGLRNPWRFSFDRLTGDLYIGDVGQNAIEEIDVQPGSSVGGENYGWRTMEGNNCDSAAACLAYVPLCGSPALTGPIHQYGHLLGCSVTGGCVYRGSAVPDLLGTYFFADYCTATIWSFRYVSGVVTDFRDRTAELAPGGGLAINTPVHFGQDARGEVYVVDHGGEIFKIVARSAVSYAVAFSGTASPTTGGIPGISLSGGDPVIGNPNLVIAGSGLVPNGVAGVLLGLGSLDPGQPVLGAPATVLLYVNPILATNLIFPDPSGRGVFGLGVPNNSSLAGLSVFSQLFDFDPNIPAAVPIGTSLGMRLVIGS